MNTPKKSLGQNFLTSKKIAQEIVAAGEIEQEDIILEVGPGKGILTEELLKKAKRVIAVEKDEQLAEFLKTKFCGSGKVSSLEIVTEDILNFDPKTCGLQPGSYKIIANIPYYITSRFLRTFLESDIQPSLMVLMVQKEVAERIVGVKDEAKQDFSRFTVPRSAMGSDASKNSALPRFSANKPARRRGKESLLSISVKSYGQPEIIRSVSAGNFSPIPNVNSAVLKISGITKNFFQNVNENNFFTLVKQGFAQKRKMLVNKIPAGKEILTACNINVKARAEDLSLAQWKNIVQYNKKEKVIQNEYF